MDPISTSIVTHLGSAIKFATPLIAKKVTTELKGMSEDILHAFTNSFESYIQNSYKHYSTFSSLVFPNQQQRLEDLYIPLTLQMESDQHIAEEVINKYPGELIYEKKKLLIVDSAGMGKSTILKYMFLKATELGVGIPIFIELRRLKKDKPILQYLTDQLRTLSGKVNEELIIRLLESGDFVFFLDGFDEIPTDEREVVTADLLKFSRMAGRNFFIASSRDQVGLTALADFYRVTIKPLQQQEAITLILKYSRNSDLGKDLIEEIGKTENNPIQEFLTNPLLVSLLFKAYEYKHTIPLKKHVFYRQVFEALYENHDLSKDGGALYRNKSSGLDIHSFEMALRAIGFLSVQSDKVEYSKDELLLLIEKSKKLTPTLEYSNHALIDDLTVQVPLLVIDGISFRWNHKSIQEYFAASYLAYSGAEFQKNVLGMMYQSEKALSYINLLSLFSDIDPKGFQFNIVINIIDELNKEFSKHVNGQTTIPPEEVKIRNGLTCFREVVFVNLEHLSDEDYLECLQPTINGGNVLHPNFIFGRGKKALELANIPIPRGSASIQHQKKTAIIYSSSRLDFLTSLSRAIKFEFFEIHQPEPINQINIHDPQLELPIEYTCLNSNTKIDFNSEVNFARVNKFLISLTSYLDYKEEIAGNIKERISQSKKEEKSFEFTF